MKLRHTITAAAITIGIGITAILPSVAGADVPGNTAALHEIFALTHAGGQDNRAFWQDLFALQNAPYDCTAYTSNIVGDGVFGGVSPVVNTPMYEGNCAQAWLLVLQHAATYYTANGNPDA